MIYITSDTHGDFTRIIKFCQENKTTLFDTIIILGDVGINYYGGKKDRNLKNLLKFLPIKLFCIKGNHENYAGNIKTYVTKEAFGGLVLVEEEYPNLLFAIDGEVYDFEVNDEYLSAIVIGGAYSIDKDYLLMRGFRWWKDEQPSDEVKQRVEDMLDSIGNKVDLVLSHTCPIQFEPTEWFLDFIDNSMVDKSTEIWLNKIYDKIEFKKWYCGHYHGEKIEGKIEFMYRGIKKLEI